MENIFDQVKKFVVVLETETIGVKPVFGDEDFVDSNSAVEYEGKMYKVPYRVRDKKHYMNFRDEPTYEVIEKITEKLEFSNVLCDLNGYSLLRILGFGFDKKVKVPFKMADDLASQNFVFASETFDEKTKIYTIFLKSTNRIHKKVDEYEEIRYELMKLAKILIELANEQKEIADQQKEWNEKQKSHSKKKESVGSKIFKLLG